MLVISVSVTCAFDFFWVFSCPCNFFISHSYPPFCIIRTNFIRHSLLMKRTDHEYSSQPPYLQSNVALCRNC